MARLSNAIRDVSELPDSFKLSKYEFALKLDAAGWYEQLFIREQVFICQDLSDKWTENDEDSLAYSMASEVWSEPQASLSKPGVLADCCGLDGAAWRVKSNYARSVHSVTCRELLQERERIDSDRRQKIESWWENILKPTLGVTDEALVLSRQVMNFIDAPLHRSQNRRAMFGFRGYRAAAEVDLTMPDAVLMEAFRAWLSEVRSDIGISSPKQYRRPDFLSWCRLGVLPYIDLLSWAELSGKSIPNRVMADAIFKPGEGGEETVRKTTAPLANEMIGRANSSGTGLLETLLAVAAQDSADRAASNSEGN